MEDARKALVRIFEESTGSKAPQHPIFIQEAEVTKDTSKLEQTRIEASLKQRALKQNLERRQQLIGQQKQNKTTPEIATLTQQIKQQFDDFQRFIDNVKIQQQKFSPTIRQKKPEEAKVAYTELEELIVKLQQTLQIFRKWEEARQNDANAVYNPAFRMAEQIEEPKLGKKATVIQQAANKAEALDEILPNLGNYEEAKQTVLQQDEELESQAARMIQKVGIIKQQVLKHKEMMDQQDEVMDQVQVSMADAKEGVKGITKTSEDLKNRLMKGEKCFTIIIVVLLVLVAIYWIYKLLIA